VWAVLLPGLVAGYIPWRYLGLRHVVVDLRQPLQWVGLLGIAGGMALLSLCLFEFARSGRGTLLPSTLRVPWLSRASIATSEIRCISASA